jgi:signal transduction histidine kinase
MLLCSVILLTTLSLLTFVFRRHLIPSLKALSYRTGAFADGSAVLLRERYGITEIDSLAVSLNDMMDKADKREEKIRVLNRQLEELVSVSAVTHEVPFESPHSAGTHQLRTGNMDVSGAIVSGAFHEINTPLGVSVTAASYLNERARNIYRDWETRSLTQKNLEQFLKDSREASGIIQNNLENAARILSSLKHVAADRQLEEIREFELGSYIRDIALSLKPVLKPSNHRIEVENSGVLVVNTCPGSITRILDNLVANSVVHGFSGEMGGLITIRTREEGGEVEIYYSDDGRGLTEEERGRISDLKFTTRRQDGESGSGLNSVFQQVAGTLKGRIEITPPENRGTGFTVWFPKDIGGIYEQQ